MRYDIIVVSVRADNEFEAEDRKAEIDRYLYGRAFLLDSVQTDTGLQEHQGTYDLTYLVETNYVQAIIDRLESGLFWARHATPEEYGELGF